jgi:hypothetical protein
MVPRVVCKVMVGSRRAEPDHKSSPVTSEKRRLAPHQKRPARVDVTMMPVQTFRMATKKPGLDGRSRDANGEIRHKRRDTLVSTLRDEYGPQFGGDISPQAHLGTVLERAGVTTLSEYLRTLHGQK